MRLSKTSEYALRILSYMARSPEELYPARLLVEKLRISDKYLRRLMTDLSKAGFIKSVQGRDGGYLFDKDISEIHLSQIIDAVEGMDKYTGCVLGFDECSDENPCVMHAAWLPIKQQLINTFQNKTLSDFNFETVNKF
jgi:Rrf2 family protein